MNQNNETITAICTPQGQGALGIIRISGADAIAITKKILSLKLDWCENICYNPKLSLFLLKIY